MLRHGLVARDDVDVELDDAVVDCERPDQLPELAVRVAAKRVPRLLPRRRDHGERGAGGQRVERDELVARLTGTRIADIADTVAVLIGLRAATCGQLSATSGMPSPSSSWPVGTSTAGRTVDADLVQVPATTRDEWDHEDGGAHHAILALRPMWPLARLSQASSSTRFST